MLFAWHDGIVVWVVLGFCAFPAAAAAAITVGNALTWHGEGTTKPICLLPFALSDGLMPGEMLQIHFSEPHQLALFETASQRDSSCVCQLLEVDDKKASSLCAFAPLLELRESRLHHEVGMWCSFACVGAVQLRDVELRTTAEETALSGIEFSLQLQEMEPSFISAQAMLLREPCDAGGVDHDSADDEQAFLAVSVEQLYAQVNQLRRQCMELNPSGERSSKDFVTSGGDRLGRPPSADDFVEYGHRLGPLVGPYVELEEHVALRSEVLRTRGVDEPPDTDLSRLAQLWGYADAEQVRRSLLAFVAVEALSPIDRLGAIAIADTNARLEHALESLTRRKNELSAEVALRRALDS